MTSMYPVSQYAARRIRHYRQSCGLTTQRLAHNLATHGYPVSKTTIADVETGRRATVPVDLVILSARILRVPLAHLLPLGPACRNCRGKPPRGYTCDTCGTSTRKDSP